MSTSLLDLAVLLAPLAGDNAAGAPVPHTLRQKLKADRREMEPHPQDPSQPDIPRRVDWNAISSVCQETLATKSRDLEVALYLVEALTKQHGYAGLREGLQLLHGLVSECWDRLYPFPDEDEGEEVRAARFHWLCDAERGALFPYTIQTLPLVKIDDKICTFHDRQQAGTGTGPVPAGDFERAMPATATVAQDIDESLAALQRLDQALEDRMGQKAPSLMALRQPLEDCARFMQGVMRRVAPTATLAAPALAGSAENGQVPGRAPMSMGGMATREDAYERLAQIADFLARLEPHSPIPDLLHRAIELGRMPFKALIQELIREPNMLAELRREFGLKEAPQ